MDCNGVGSGEEVLLYLGRYLYRGVIQEKDIIACASGQVTFRYRNSKTKRIETRTVSCAKFLWLLLQHVLPKGFRRARNFGFMHPNSKQLIQLLHVLLRLEPSWISSMYNPSFLRSLIISVVLPVRNVQRAPNFSLYSLRACGVSFFGSIEME